MARIKLTAPEKFNFTSIIPVRITDLNYGGHVGNDALLSIIHEARLQFLNHHGYSEMDLGGVGMIMADVAIEFKQEAFYGDILIASVKAHDFNRIGFDLFYRLEKEINGEKVLAALAKTGMICYHYTTKKISAIPSEVLEKLQESGS